MGKSRSGRPATRPKKSLDRARPLWERQAKESDPAWQAFVIYRELGLDRNLTTACTRVGKSHALLGGWSTEWSWRERCNSYEAEKDRQVQEASKARRIAEVTNMQERHLGIAADFQRLGQVELRRHMRKLKVDAKDPDFSVDPEIAIDQIRAVIGDGVKLERINRGEPDGIQKTMHEGEIKILTWSDLAEDAARK